MSTDPFQILNSHFTVSRETFDRLKIYHDLLLKWQSKINLVSNNSIGDSWTRHFLDSLQLTKFLPPSDSIIIDVGSGSGFPGMVLSIVGIKNIHLVDSDAKKISFLQEVKRLTGAGAVIRHGRIENLEFKNCGVVMARAVSGLSTLLEQCSRFVSHETICLFPKGKNYAMEIEDAKREWRFDCDVLSSVTDESAAILRIANLQRRNDIHGKELNRS